MSKYELGLYDFEQEKFVSLECDELSPKLLLILLEKLGSAPKSFIPRKNIEEMAKNVDNKVINELNEEAVKRSYDLVKELCKNNPNVIPFKKKQ